MWLAPEISSVSIKTSVCCLVLNQESFSAVVGCFIPRKNFSDEKRKFFNYSSEIFGFCSPTRVFRNVSGLREVWGGVTLIYEDNEIISNMKSLRNLETGEI